MKTTLLLCVMAFGGCSSTPMPELSYRADLPQSIEVTTAVASDFAGSLAREADLRVVGQSKQTGNPDVDATQSIDLRPSASDKIFVLVMVNVQTRTLFVYVGGDFESQAAKTIARKAEELYVRKYPGSTLTSFTRYRGLFGP